MSVLVTGGTGFVGGWLRAHLEALGHLRAHPGVGVHLIEHHLPAEGGLAVGFGVVAVDEDEWSERHEITFYILAN